MKREILFKGKMIDGQGWIYGFLASKSDIVNYEDDAYSSAVVKPDTVCQFTGLTDKNGTKIFEGDIVKSERQLPIYNMFEENEYGGEIVMVEHVVKWYDNSAGFSLEPIGFTELMNESLCLCHLQEVVGNIYENKYLHSSRTE